METFLALTVLIFWLDSQIEPPPVVVPPVEESVTVQEIPENAVNVTEVMALKEVLEKVVDLQKKEGEE